jgi:carboxyl-terminal processing protease
VELLPEDITRYDADQAKKDRQTQWLNNLKNDIYLNETVNVVNNMISQQAIVKSK